MNNNLYARHRFPAEIISHCVWVISDKEYPKKLKLKMLCVKEQGATRFRLTTNVIRQLGTLRLFFEPRK